MNQEEDLEQTKKYLKFKEIKTGGIVFVCNANA